MSDDKRMNISDEAVEAIHSAICEESLEDHMDPEWPGRCVKAAHAAAPHLIAHALDEASEQLEYGNPIGDWLHDRAESYRSAGSGE